MKVEVWKDGGVMVIRDRSGKRKRIYARGVEEMKLNLSFLMLDSYEDREDFWAGHSLYAEIPEEDYEIMAQAARR